MTIEQLVGEEKIEGLKQGYLRYEALHARIQQTAAEWSTLGGPGRAGDAALHGLLWPSSAPAPDPGVDALLHDVQRVSLFCRYQFDQTWSKLVGAVLELRATAEQLLRQGADAESASCHLDQLRKGLDGIGADAAALDAFFRHNVAACAHLAQLADAAPMPARDVGLDGRYLAAAESALLGTLRFDSIILGLSDCYELLRLMESDVAAAAAAVAGKVPMQRWVAPQEFRRATRKFWILPRNVTRFKMEVVKHLPVLIYGDRRKLTEVDPGDIPLMAPPPTLDSGSVTSVYLDALPDLPSYHERLRREDGASAVRVRWYGDRTPFDPGQPLYVERKVHREALSNEFSTKERAQLAQGEVLAFLEGRLVVDLGTKEGALLGSVQSRVAALQQKPLLQTSYRRTAFQLSTDNIVRVSLDTDLMMTRDTPNCRTPGDWCRDTGAFPPGPSDAVHFPYGVVEVKLQAKPPAWLTKLVDSGLLMVVPKFSKFLHGTAALYQEYTETVPHWFLPDETNPAIMTPATWDEMTDTADAYAASAADWLFPRSFEPPSPPPRHRDRKLRRHSRLGRFFSRRPDQTAEKHLPYDEQGGNNGENNGLEGGGADGARRPSQGSEGGNSSGSTAEAVSIAALPEHSVAVDIALIEGMIPGPNGGAHPEKLNPGASPGSSPDLQSAGTPSASERHGTGRSTPQDAGDDIEAGRGSGPRDPGDLHAAVTQRIRSTMASSRVAPVPAATVDLVGKGGGAVPDPKSYAVTQYQPNLASMNGSVMGGGDSGGACGGGYMVTKSGRTKSLVRTRVEPKTFFANERTFLQWLNISVLVMFLALSLLSGSSLISSAGPSASGGAGVSKKCASGDKQCFASKLSGALIAPVALAFMAYALFMYKKRTIQILRRETVRYDDQRGPVVLVVILLAVMVISYVLALIYVF